MRLPRFLVAPVSIASFVLSPLGPALAAPCPESCVNSTLIGTTCSTAATRDTTASAACAPFGTTETREAYNLVLGTVLARAQSCDSAPVNGFVSVYARDRFRLVGPAGPAVIPFQAKLRCSGSAGGFGTVGATLGEIGGAYLSVNDGGLGGFDTELVLPLSHAVGEEFALAYEVSASAQSTAQAQGVLSFAGLPPGYGITSCQGFAGEGAVPVRRASWGAVKSHYR